MPIRVTCPGCHTRFNVSDKFAGKEGPCPKCKKVIKVPSQDEEVVVHAPELGPKDNEGRPVLKPIERADNSLSQLQIVLLCAVILGFLAMAFMLRFTVEDKSKFPDILLYFGAAGLSIPVVYGTYGFLRDPELGGFLGKELWTRVGICSAVYAVLWLAMPLMKYTFDGYEWATWASAIVGMVGLGGAMGMLLLDFDYIIGMVHASMYFGVCILGRWIVGIGALPGMSEPADGAEEKTTSLISTLFSSGFFL